MLYILQLIAARKAIKNRKMLKHIWYHSTIWRHIWAPRCRKEILFLVPSFRLLSCNGARRKCRTNAEDNFSLVSVSIWFSWLYQRRAMRQSSAHFAKAVQAIASLSFKCSTTMIKLSSIGASCYFETQESIFTYPHNIYIYIKGNTERGARVNM